MRTTQRPLVCLVALTMVTTMIPSSASHPGAEFTSPASEDDCTPHPPIEIHEDEGPHGFTLGEDPITGDPLYRSGSGVTGGTGTSQDPYIIEGWCIQDYGTPYLWVPGILGVPSPIPQGLLIQGTDAHVKIQGNTFTGQDLTTQAPSTASSNGLVGQTGILIQDASNVHIHDNHLQANGLGILAQNAKSLTIQGNHIQDGNNAIKLDDTHGALLQDNLISENEKKGIELIDASENTIRSNTITNHGWTGIILIGESHGNELLDNQIQDNRDGIATWSSDAEIRGNNIEGNENGVEVRQTDDLLHAQENWWGHADGPSGGVWDACEGTFADGPGDAVNTVNAQLCFDPWLDAPNPDAGAP